MAHVDSYSSEWKWLFSSFKKPSIEAVDEANQRSLNVVIVLSLFLGWTGLDRFYLGKLGTGILKLMTLGGLGIWWLIDLYLLTGPRAQTDVCGVALKESERYWFTYLFLTVFGAWVGVHYHYLGFRRLALTRLGAGILYLILLVASLPTGRGYSYQSPNEALVFLTGVMVLFLAAWTILDIYLAVTGKITADAEGNPLASGEPKYQSVCLLFAIIGGFYGFDRFYLGHRVLGLLKIFTFGGLFVWYGLDIILAILNAHKDSSGRPLAQG